MEKKPVKPVMETGGILCSDPADSRFLPGGGGVVSLWVSQVSLKGPKKKGKKSCDDETSNGFLENQKNKKIENKIPEI